MPRYADGEGKYLGQKEEKTETKVVWDMSLIAPRTRPEIKGKKSERLENLLAEIKKQDDLFERNIPARYREEFDEEKMLTHVRETYIEKEFIIRDPEEILKYVSSMDRIITTCAIQNERKVIRAYEELIITKVSKDQKTATVRTTEREKKNIFETNISIDKLIPYGTEYSSAEQIFDGERTKYLAKNGDLHTGISKEQAKKNVADGICANPKYLKSLSKRNLVVTTEDVSFSEYFIPEGSEGFVVGKSGGHYINGIKQPDWIHVFWIPQKGMKTTRKFESIYNKPESRIQLNAPAEPQQVILIKQNKIKFDELYQSIYTENRDGIVRVDTSLITPTLT